MKRALIVLMAAGAVALIVRFAPDAVSLAAGQAGQRGAPNAAPIPAATAPPEPAPRMSDGKPDLSGVWWNGGDVGSRGLRGGGARGARGAPAPPSFTSLYNAAALEKAKTLNDSHDPTLRCIPTAFGTLNVSLYSVGAVGQIISTPKFVVMLQETYHGYQLIPTDGRKHREDIPPSYRGDSVGRWEGDTFVVDTTNFTDDTWMFAEGRVSFHSDALHIVERYRRVDKNTLEIEATVEDPKVLTGPWTVPKQTLVLAPFDQIMALNCSTESDSVMQGAFKPIAK
jgi:hypothetical protein